jgi:ribonuclease VapC
MFVDASALVAMLTFEPEAEDLTRKLEASEGLITSPVTIFETVASVARKTLLDADTTSREVHAFLRNAGVKTVVVDALAAHGAIEAHARYGRGSGHPARLNLGDCFAYAMAKQHGVPLLYNGDDFSETDLA